jgi:tetratricopeptide (TPR) repeat protein
MSLILEALKRTEANRKLGPDASIKIDSEEEDTLVSRSKWPRVVILTLFVVIIGIFGTSYYLKTNKPQDITAELTPPPLTPVQKEQPNTQTIVSENDIAETNAAKTNVAKIDTAQNANIVNNKHDGASSSSAIGQELKRPNHSEPVASSAQIEENQIPSPVGQKPKEQQKQDDNVVQVIESPLDVSHKESSPISENQDQLETNKPVEQAISLLEGKVLPKPALEMNKVDEPSNSVTAQSNQEPPVSPSTHAEQGTVSLTDAVTPLTLKESVKTSSIEKIKTEPAQKSPTDKKTVPSSTVSKVEIKVPAVESRKSPIEMAVPPVKPKVPLRSVAVKSDPLKQAEGFEKNGQLDRAIEAYTRVIESNPQLVDGFVGRGWVHEANRAYEAAISDFTKAIELQPGSSQAYYARGWVQEQSRRPTPAIKDYSSAIERQPSDYQSYFSRGYLRFYQEDIAASIEDFQVVHANADAELADYALIWMYLANSQQGANKVSSGNPTSVKKARTAWPGIIYSVLTGRATTDKLLNAMTDQDGFKRREKECVGYFFLGLNRLQQGDQDGAIGYFKKTVATGITSYRQYWAARHELQKLGVN